MWAAAGAWATGVLLKARWRAGGICAADRGSDQAGERPRGHRVLNRIGHNLVRNSDAQVLSPQSDRLRRGRTPYGPARRIFLLNSGLILAADEEAEMAGVMAHEIADVAACHDGRN